MLCICLILACQYCWNHAPSYHSSHGNEHLCFGIMYPSPSCWSFPECVPLFLVTCIRVWLLLCVFLSWKSSQLLMSVLSLIFFYCTLVSTVFLVMCMCVCVSSANALMFFLIIGLHPQRIQPASPYMSLRGRFIL